MPPISERGVEKAAAETLRPRPARSPNNQLRPAVRPLSSNQKSEDGFGPSVRPLYNESVLLKIAVFAAKTSNWARQQSECHPDSGARLHPAGRPFAQHVCAPCVTEEVGDRRRLVVVPECRAPAQERQRAHPGGGVLLKAVAWTSILMTSGRAKKKRQFFAAHQRRLTIAATNANRRMESPPNPGARFPLAG